MKKLIVLSLFFLGIKSSQAQVSLSIIPVYQLDTTKINLATRVNKILDQDWYNPVIPIKIKSNKLDFKAYFKSHKVSFLFTFLGGMADGARDVTMFHFNNGNSWWNGKESWKRKYKNGDPLQGPAFFGSTSIFVAVTDGPHFFNMLETQFESFSLATAPQGSKKFGRVVRDAFIYTGIKLLGRVIIYNGVFKDKNY